MTPRERKLVKIIIASMLKSELLPRPTFAEWCTAFDELFPSSETKLSGSSNPIPPLDDGAVERLRKAFDGFYNCHKIFISCEDPLAAAIWDEFTASVRAALQAAEPHP